MFKQSITLETLTALALGLMTTSADAVGMLLPAVQKVPEAAAKIYADTDGDGIADAIVWFGEVKTADGDVTPVLLVISDQQDFYYQEYGDTRASGEGDERILVAQGPALVGNLNEADGKHKYVGAVCYGVSVLAYARVDGESLSRPIIKIVADTGREPFVLALQLMF